MKLENLFFCQWRLFWKLAIILPKKVDGNQRRICAEKFVNQVTQALEGESPFTPINFLKQEDLQGWLKEFPDQAMQRRGLGDLSIIHDWQKICDQNPSRRVYK